MAKTVPAHMTSNCSGKGSLRLALYAGLGPQLLHYDVDVKNIALIRLNDSVKLPANIQYACPHSSGRYFYVLSSNGGPGMAGNAHYVSAFRIDPESGVLHPHGNPIPLPYRPIQITTDIASRHALIVYNDPSTVTIFRIARDGTLAAEVEQSTSLDTGIFAHQICVTPSNKAAILVTRGNDASAEKTEDPGALKIFRYSKGMLTNWMSIAPAGGYGFGPRNIDINPNQPWIYVSLERQNKLVVFKMEGDTVSPEPLFQSDTLIDPRNIRPKQMAGAVHAHPNGRFVYLANRAFGTTEYGGKKVFIGGENTIAVYAIEDGTGKPKLIQIVDTQGIYPRTFSIDPSGKMLVVANLRPLMVRDGRAINFLPANLSVFSIGSDGTLIHMHRYDINLSQEDLFWSGMVCFSLTPDGSN